MSGLPALKATIESIAELDFQGAVQQCDDTAEAILQQNDGSSSPGAAAFLQQVSQARNSLNALVVELNALKTTTTVYAWQFYLSARPTVDRQPYIDMVNIARAPFQGVPPTPTTAADLQGYVNSLLASIAQAVNNLRAFPLVPTVNDAGGSFRDHLCAFLGKKSTMIQIFGQCVGNFNTVDSYILSRLHAVFVNNVAAAGQIFLAHLGDLSTDGPSPFVSMIDVIEHTSLAPLMANLSDAARALGVTSSPDEAINMASQLHAAIAGLQTKLQDLRTYQEGFVGAVEAAGP